MVTTENTTLRQNLIRLLRRGHGDMMDVLQVADQANWNALALENWQEKNRQTKEMFASACPQFTTGETEEGEEEMGNFTFINAGLMADEKTSSALLQALAREEHAKADATHQSPAPEVPTEPTPQPEQPVAETARTEPIDPQAAIQQAVAAALAAAAPKPLDFLGHVKKWMGRILPLLAVAGLSIAAARYFAPEDGRNFYDIQALPYVAPDSP